MLGAWLGRGGAGRLGRIDCLTGGLSSGFLSDGLSSGLASLAGGCSRGLRTSGGFSFGVSGEGCFLLLLRGGLTGALIDASRDTVFSVSSFLAGFGISG